MQFGLLHYSEEKGKYLPVRYIKGGGTREIEVPAEVTRVELLQIAKQTFFPDGTNNFGSIDSMACSVANFCGDEMADTTLSTLGQYVEKHKLSSRIRYFVSENDVHRRH